MGAVGPGFCHQNVLSRTGAENAGDEARDTRHALLTWHAAAPPSFRWPLLQQSLGVVCARRKAVCRGAPRCRQGCRTPPHRRPASEESEDSVNIPEDVGIAIGALAGILRSSIHCGAVDNHSGSENSSETRRCT